MGVARQRPLSAIPAAEREADDPQHRGPEDPQVEPDRAIRDVFEVVDQLVLPGILPRDPGLREAGHAGANDRPLPVLRDLLAEPVEEGWSYRSRADDAH